MRIGTRLAARSLHWIPRERISRGLGRLAAARTPTPLVRAAVRAFCRSWSVDLSDAVVPDGGFPTFDAFFTRALRPGARPVDADPEVFVSPCDGRLEDAGPIDHGASFRIKGRLYDVEELVADAELARALDGGSFAVIYLAPADYHRVHAPEHGRVVRVRHVPGSRFPVNAIGVQAIPRLLARNERCLVVQRTVRGDLVVTVLVGALGVGSIRLAFDVPGANHGRPPACWDGEGPSLARGDHLGTFHLGSTVVLLAQAGAKPLVEAGRRVRMGIALMRREIS